MTHHKMFKRGVLRGGSALSALAMLGAGLATTAIIAPAPAAAQDYTRGTLQGTILTSAGEPMTGATVTLTSNEQGFARTTTTDATGGFRFALLPTGSYTLRAEGPGGESVVDPNVPVVAGAANTYTYTAAATGAAATAAADEEAIVITGTRVQTADFGSTQTGVTIDVQSLVESVPVPRTQSGLILVAPGTTSGDANFTDCSDCVSIGGATIAENSYYVNGLNTTNFRTLVGNNTVPFEFYRTFEVKTGGYSAEFGRALGGVTSAVTKSGSNNWEAGAVVAWQPDEFTADAPNTFTCPGELGAVCPDGVGTNQYKNLNEDDYRSRVDANFYLSGPLIKDRLFFYALYNPRWIEQEDTVISSNYRFVQRSNDPFYGAKVDAIIADGHRLEGTWFYDKRDTTVDFIRSDLEGNLSDRAGREVSTSGGHNWILQYTGSFTDWFTLSAAYGENNYTRRAVASTENPIVSTQIGRTAVVRGLPLLAGNPTNSEDKRTIYRADADFYFDLFGSHHVRLGYDREDLNSLEETFYTGDYAYLFTNNYIRRRLYLNTGEFTSRQTAFYIQDDWDLFNERLNLQLGLRNDNYQNSSVEGTKYLEMKNQWAPRLGASFDVFGDKRTRVRAFYGRYYLGVPTNTNIRLAGQELYYEQRFLYAPGVVGSVADASGIPIGQQFDANGHPILGGLNSQNVNPCPAVGPDSASFCSSIFSDGVLGPTDTLVAANLDPMFQDEIILGASHRMNDWTFGINYTRRRLQETLEDVAIDEAVLEYCDANGIEGCEDYWSGFHQYVLVNPGKDVTVRLDGGEGCELDARMCDVVTLSAESLGYPKPVRKYDAVEFTARKAFNGLYAFDFSYTWAKVRGNYEGSVKSDNNQDDAGLTQDFDQPGLTDGSYGILANERKHTFKLFGYVKPTEWMSIGANVLVQSPRNFSCIGVHPVSYFDVGVPGAASLYQAASFWCANSLAADRAVDELDGSYLVPRGTAFKSNWNKNIDLGVQFELPGALSGSSFRIDVFNVLNWKSKIDFVEFGDNNNGTPRNDYQLPTGYQSPRAVRLTWALRFGGERRERSPVTSSGQ